MRFNLFILLVCILAMVITFVLMFWVLASIDIILAEGGVINSIQIENDAFYGVASWYSYTLKDGWDSTDKPVCAARDFERYSQIRVTNIANGKSAVCKITDYGPDLSIHPDRIVDLSPYVFTQLAPLNLGVIKIKVEQL